MSIYDDLPAIQHGIDGVWSGKIATAPATVDDTLMVTIPAFDKHARIGPCVWVTHGATLPERGNDCIVVWDENQRPIVIAWWEAAGGGA